MIFRSRLALIPLFCAALAGCGGITDQLTQRVDVEPSTPVLTAGQNQNLSATLLDSGTPGDYTWTLREGSSGGTLTPQLDGVTGLHSRAVYTAPSAPGIYHVDVKTTIDTVTEKGTSTITVQ